MHGPNDDDTEPVQEPLTENEPYTRPDRDGQHDGSEEGM